MAWFVSKWWKLTNRFKECWRPCFFKIGTSELVLRNCSRYLETVPMPGRGWANEKDTVEWAFSFIHLSLSLKLSGKNKYFTKSQFKQIRVNSEALPSLEESYIDDGRVEVDKLEDKHFKCKLVFKLCLGPVHLCNNNKTNIFYFFKNSVLL